MPIDHDPDSEPSTDALRPAMGYWRGLGANGRPTHGAGPEPEFREGAGVWDDAEGRRRFLKVMGASMTLAGLAGCTVPPREKIVPYVDAPEQIVPGKPAFYATSFVHGGYAEGVLVESHMGRPTKVEGNPDHPASLGATTAFAQASVLGLYDPDRSTVPLYRGETASWETFLSHVRSLRTTFTSTRGRGLRLLTETVTSPTLARQIEQILDVLPEAQWHQYDPLSPDHSRQGLHDALGRYVQPVYHFDRADVVFSLGADFLSGRPGSLRYARDFAAGRRIRTGHTAMSRLYVAETTPSITGAMADHCLPLPPSLLVRLAHTLGVDLGLTGTTNTALSDEARAWLAAVVDDLEAHRGRCLVLAGEMLPPAMHALVYAINDALGNTGQTVSYGPPVEARPTDHTASLRTLVDDVKAGRVHTLVMLGGNPAYTAPADLAFAEALAKVRTSVHLSLHVDETSAACTWHLPRTHYLETWSDARAFDGTPSIIQPLIAPLYDPCRSDHEVLSALAGRPGLTSHQLVRAYWRDVFLGEDFEASWEEALYAGVLRLDDGTWKMEDGGPASTGASSIADGGSSRTAAAEADGPASTSGLPAEASRASGLTTGNEPSDEARSTTDGQTSTIHHPASTDTETPTLEIAFLPDPTIYDGRYANNGWLQELAKPITKLVWDNAAMVSPALAERFGLKDEDVVTLGHRGRTVEAPVVVVPGHADGAVTVHLGYGRTRAGRTGNGAGFDAYRLRTSDAPWSGDGVTLEKTGATYDLVSVQHHHSMEGRSIVEEADVERFRRNPAFVHENEPVELPTLYPKYEYDGYKWGMSIDANTCIGCNACLTACQAENNIPVVGKQEVGNGREMLWLRIDRYYKGPAENPDTYFLPVPCQHCEDAPCEIVCPVYATVHDDEGLNVMVYNRCIGTRYCSNNCPYKVRRFNFLLYSDWTTESLKMVRNPDVTVRSRGVMEKCTYCVQRISAARITAKREGRRIRDGEVRTACQMACPTEAITFGDLNDAGSAVRALQDQPHTYSLLGELGTRPRTTYLPRFHNPNPAMPAVARRGESIGQESRMDVEVGQ